MNIDAFKTDISILINKYDLNVKPLIMDNIKNLIPHLTDREIEDLYQSSRRYLGPTTKEHQVLRGVKLKRKYKKKKR